jgi:hypothetical protein
MTAWLIDEGLRTGQYDLPAIERQLGRTAATLPQHHH